MILDNLSERLNRFVLGYEAVFSCFIVVYLHIFSQLIFIIFINRAIQFSVFQAFSRRDREHSSLLLGKEVNKKSELCDIRIYFFLFDLSVSIIG